MLLLGRSFSDHVKYLPLAAPIGSGEGQPSVEPWPLTNGTATQKVKIGKFLCNNDNTSVFY